MPQHLSFKIMCLRLRALFGIIVETLPATPLLGGINNQGDADGKPGNTKSSSY
jgi:hypothetical protein